MRQYYILITLSIAAIVMSCNKNECNEAFETYKFEVGKHYCIGTTSYFTIDSIGDWRCPKNVECIYAGATKLYTQEVNEDVFIPFDIQVPNDNRQFIIEGGNALIFTIDSITPYPIAGIEVAQKDYRVYMTLKRKTK